MDGRRRPERRAPFTREAAVAATTANATTVTFLASPRGPAAAAAVAEGEAETKKQVREGEGFSDPMASLSSSSAAPLHGGGGGGGHRTSDPPSSPSSPSPHPLQQQQQQQQGGWQNKNVRGIFLYSFLDGACYSLWGAQLLSIFINKEFGVTAVGTAAAAAGVAQLLSALLTGICSALPAKYNTDHHNNNTSASFTSSHGAAREGEREAEDGEDGRSHPFNDINSRPMTNCWRKVVQRCFAQRIFFIRAGTLFGALAILSFLFVVGAATPAAAFRWLVVAQVLYGLYMGLVSTSSEALFADSILTGRRTALYNCKWVLQTLCYCVGYTAAMLLLSHASTSTSAPSSASQTDGGSSDSSSSTGAHASSWDMASMRQVLRVGLYLHPFAFIPLFLLHDRYAVGAAAAEDVVVVVVSETTTPVEEADGGNQTQNHQHHNTNKNSVSGRGLVEEVEPNVIESGKAHLASDASAPGQVDNEAEETFAPPLYNTSLAVRAVPYIVCAVDFLLSVGSGMTLQYFSIFFVERCGMGPRLIYTNYLLSTLLTAFFSSVVVQCLLLPRLGRLGSVFAVRAVGISVLLLLALLPVPASSSSSSSSFSSAAPAEGAEKREKELASFQLTVSALFVLRNGCMNAVFGITRSLIMDSLREEREKRALFAAFESVTSLAWSGSAFLGGMLIQHWNNNNNNNNNNNDSSSGNGFQHAFLVTAMVHAAATLLLLAAAPGARVLEREMADTR